MKITFSADAGESFKNLVEYLPNIAVMVKPRGGAASFRAIVAPNQPSENDLQWYDQVNFVMCQQKFPYNPLGEQKLIHVEKIHVL